MHLDTRYNSHATFGGKSYRVAMDTESGKRYAKIAEVCPDPVDEKTTQIHDSIMGQNPTHYASDEPGYTGFWVPADQLSNDKK